MSSIHDLPDVATMTPAQRGEEMRAWKKAALVDCTFSQLHERIEKLVGRPVYTHELGIAFDQLIAEAGGERPTADLDEILDTAQAAFGDRLVVVPMDGEAPPIP